MKRRTAVHTNRTEAEAQRQRRNAAAAYVQWAQTQQWQLAVTLDFGSGISRERAEAIARHYWQKMDCLTFGAGQVKRQNRRLRRIAFWHGGGQRNWHLHVAVQLEGFDDDWRSNKLKVMQAKLFAEGLRQHWKDLKGTGRHCDVELVRNDEAWLNYIRREEHYRGESFAAAISTQLT